MTKMPEPDKTNSHETEQFLQWASLADVNTQMALSMAALPVYDDLLEDGSTSQTLKFPAAETERTNTRKAA